MQSTRSTVSILDHCAVLITLWRMRLIFILATVVVASTLAPNLRSATAQKGTAYYTDFPGVSRTWLQNSPAHRVQACDRTPAIVQALC
jgi:hypothetical protein